MKVVSKCEKTGRTIVRTVNEEKSKTDPSFSEQCDANHIMARFKATGQITHLAKRRGSYADVSEVPDLLQAFEIQKNAQEEFMRLPAVIRRRFENRMENYVSFMMDPIVTGKHQHNYHAF